MISEFYKSACSTATLYSAACEVVLESLPANSVDAIVTDPPYGLSFMGKKWDYNVPSVDVWAKCLRVLKPGGYLLAFAGTRTQHRMACNIEDAGFEIRDMIAWLYGTGFPKGIDVSKAIDKAAGGKRRKIKTLLDRGERKIYGKFSGAWDVTEPDTQDAIKWSGFGTALKPALEPITLARKPLTQSVAKNVLEHGTGALNIGACKIFNGERVQISEVRNKRDKASATSYDLGTNKRSGVTSTGRFPANVIHDSSEEVTQLLNGAARFFYTAKACGKDRTQGRKAIDNKHPTVKPTKLMRYLCRLVTQPGGVVLDPFMGSGSTGKACAIEGFSFIGIDQDAGYCEIAKKRIEFMLARRALALQIAQQRSGT